MSSCADSEGLSQRDPLPDDALAATFTERNHPALHYEYMVGDKLRMESYKKVIVEAVKPGDVVADIGTGLGVLAMMAAKLAGAKKVYAIDLNPRSLWMAKHLAKANGVADKICFIEADAQQVELSQKVDVILSEIIGSFGCEEGVAEVITRFAIRNLRKGGICIPSKVNTFLIPVEYTDSFRNGWTSDNAGLDLTLPMQIRMTEEPVRWYVRGRQKELSEPLAVEALAFDSEHIFEGKVKRPEARDLVFSVKEPGTLQGFIGYFEVELSPGTSLSNYPPYDKCHWENWHWPVTPHVEVFQGDRLRVEMSRTFVPGTTKFAKESKDKLSGWEPVYDWAIKWDCSRPPES